MATRSFEAVFGPKTDRWLMHTVSGLLIAAGWTQRAAAAVPAARPVARNLGLGTATTLLAIDLIYVTRGRIRWTYLIDAAMEAAWILAWLRADPTAEPTDTTSRAAP